MLRKSDAAKLRVTWECFLYHNKLRIGKCCVCSLDEGCATGNAQSGECRDGCLDNCPEDLCPGDFLGFVVGFIHGNICFLSV